MSISGIQSNVVNPYQPVANPVQQEVQQLGQYLQSGNVSAAQSDFATLQQAVSQPATSGTTSNSTYAATSNAFEQAFQQLGSDLKSGNVSAAQKDLNTVQQELKGLHDPLSHRFHHHHGSGGWNAVPDGQNSLIQDLNLVGQGLASSNLTGAQQAYTTLQQQLQQFALGSGAVSAESPVSLDA